MHKVDLVALKNLSLSFEYIKNKEKHIDNKEMLNIGKNIAESFDYKTGQLTEETLDDFDTVYEALRSGVEVELKNFIVNLLSNNVENFIWSFVNPTTETFREAWEFAFNKFNVSDEQIREQFLNRMKILFRNIFLEKMNIGDEATALELADAYFTVFKVAISQMFDEIKNNMQGQSPEIAQDWKDASTREVEYR